MKKYYIPISTLNFNNILSSESVSPKAFYEMRGFGYSRWTSIPESPCDFVVTLYDKPCAFTRPKSDIEDHPFLLEIQTEEEFNSVADGVFYSDHTLYLNPCMVRFIFFSDHDKKVALSLTENSSETKMLRVYQKRIVVETFSGTYGVIDWQWPIQPNISAIEHDQRINKLKGLLYGYYVGACISTSATNVKRFACYLEVQNIFAAIASSALRVPTEQQEKRLNEISYTLNCCNPLYKELVDFEGDRIKADALIALLSRHNVNIFKDDISALASSICSDKSPECKAIHWIKEKISRTQENMFNERKYLSPDDEQIVIVDGSLSKINGGIPSDDITEKICKVWVNDILSRPEYTGKVSSCKEKLSDALTFKAKEVLGEKWEESNVRTYMNLLRRHVRGESFESNWDSGVLASIAAVLSKGDDWENLLRFVQSKGLSDYRLIFAFYGELNGFANLTRDFTDNIMRVENPERIKTYEEFYGQLHGIKIDLTKSGDNIVPTLKSQVIAFIDSPDFTYRPKKNGVMDSLKTGALNAFAQIGSNPAIEPFLRVLSKFSGWGRNNKPFDLVQKKFAPELVKETRRKKKSKEIDAPTFPGLVMEDSSEKKSGMSGRSLLDDVSAWIDICANMISDDKARFEFVKDIRWFVGNHASNFRDAKRGNMPGRFMNEDKGNLATLARLEEHLNKKLVRWPEQEWICETYKKIPIDSIMTYLRKKYV